jgi:hypothetical protein
MSWSALRPVAWCLVLAAAGFGCNGTSGGEVDPCLTALRINLEVDGAVINEVDYAITGDNIDAIEGSINTSAPGATASVEHFGLPAGSGYVIMMIATSVDSTLTCGGSASFNVEMGETTSIDVILHCKGAQQFGGVRVNGELNVCPELDKVIVAPLQTSRGYTLEVEADASDEDDEADAIAYLWTATDGAFDDPDAKMTLFVCGETVEEQLTIEVSDGYCMDSWTVDVRCVEDNGTGGSGGDGGTGGSGGTPDECLVSLSVE